MPFRDPAAHNAYHRAYAAAHPRSRKVEREPKTAKPKERDRSSPSYLKSKAGYQVRRREKQRYLLPFVAIDSEGFSHGEAIELAGDKGSMGGRQRYQPHGSFLWGAGASGIDLQWLSAIGSELSGDVIREWLLDLPAIFGRSIFVAFSFSYDVAQILKDLPYEKAWEIQHGKPFDRPDAKENRNRIVFWQNYGFKFLKSKSFTLYKLKSSSCYIFSKTGKRCLNAQSKIEIFDVFGFFQASFLSAIKSMPGVATKEEYDLIVSGKKERSTFDPSAIDWIKTYTAQELICLSRMMELLREKMLAEGIKIRHWHGAGSIAAALMKRENVKQHLAQVETKDIPYAQIAAHHAYFGGRIELIRQGSTRKPLYAYDIASAYPAIASHLSGMQGGVFVSRLNPSEREIHNSSILSIIRLKTHGFPPAPFYPLPYRTGKGSILYPRAVHGWYMRDEVLAALKWRDQFGGDIDFIELLEFRPLSDDKPFVFLQSLFDYRLTLDKRDITQIVIKLGINSVYGKLAQAVGGQDKAPSLSSPWHAAAITAGTRARLVLAALSDPEAIVMFATDGIVSLRPLPLEIPQSKTLGAWEAETCAAGGVFAQSGVYALSDAKGDFKSKTRGFRPTNIQGDIATYLKDTIPALWQAGEASLAFPYSQYMTLGASVASRELWPFCGTWAAGARVLDLKSVGLKRDIEPSKAILKRRARELVSTRPANTNMLSLDVNGEMLISAMFRPDWIDDEFGRANALEAEQEAIEARFS